MFSRDMSPFRTGQPCIKLSAESQANTWRVPLVLALCVGVGFGAVAWRAKAKADAARNVARTEAKALATGVELELNQAVTAAEALGALVKQGTASVSNFQRIASEFLAANPSLELLQLEPGGVVRDIVPRAGHERTLGVNVFRDAGQQTTAKEALEKRVLTVAGPLVFDHGALNIVARDPVFQRASDGRDSFWGFVAVAMRLQQALNRAHLDDLVRQGYEMAFFAPASGQQTAVGIALHRLRSLRDTVQEPVKVQNLSFRLALMPQGGWIDRTEVTLESIVVLLLSALVALCVTILANRRVMEAELQATAQQLARESADRTQAQADYRGANEKVETLQAELRQTQFAVRELESERARVQARLDGETVAKNEAIQSNRAELQAIHAASQKAQETIAKLQGAVAAAVQEKDAALEARARLERESQARTAELQLQLRSAIQAGRQAADASAARLAELEQRNSEVMARLVVAERSEARVTELEALLQKAQEQLGARQEPSPWDALTSPLQPDNKALVPVPAPQASTGGMAAEEGKPQNPLEAHPGAGNDSTKPEKEQPDITASPPPESGLTDPCRTAASSLRTQGAVPQPALQVDKGYGAKARSPAEPSMGREALKPPRRKNPRRDDQLTLFGSEASSTPAAKRPRSETGETAQPNVAVGSPKEEEPAPSRHARAAPPIDATELRKAVNQIVPLLAESDPGAKDCLRDNRKTFRSAFTPEAYTAFEELVRHCDSSAALEHLKKAVRKYGISA